MPDKTNNKIFTKNYYIIKSDQPGDDFNSKTKIFIYI